MLHIDQSFKCEDSPYNFTFIVSFQYREIYVAVLQYLSNGTIRIFSVYAISIPFCRHVHAMRCMVRHQIRVWMS